MDKNQPKILNFVVKVPAAYESEQEGPSPTRKNIVEGKPAKGNNDEGIQGRKETSARIETIQEKVKTVLAEETTRPYESSNQLQQSDKKPNLVQMKIKEFSAKLNHPNLKTKPPSPHLDAPAPSFEKGRRPSSNEKGQGTSNQGKHNKNQDWWKLVTEGNNDQ